MRLIPLSILATVTFLPGFVAAQNVNGLDLKGKTVAQVHAELAPKMDKDFAVQQQWQTLCLQLGAPGREAQRTEAVRLMLEQLGNKAPVPTRLFLIRQLELVGRGESVPALARLLHDGDELVRDAARRALAHNPSAEAIQPLLAQLAEGPIGDRVGIINALGFQHNPKAVEALAKELRRGEPRIRKAAAQALGKIATREAAQALAAARQVRGTDMIWVNDAYLRCADQRLRAGEAEAARAIYQELFNPPEPRSIRMAALAGLLHCVEDAGSLVLLQIAKGDADARQVALGAVAWLSPASLRTIAAGLSKLAPDHQVQALNALASRGDRQLKQAALAAVKSTNEKVQQAGVRALGKMGDASVVPSLVELMYKEPKLGASARASLAEIAGQQVDEAIVSLLREQKDVGKRTALIGILESRRSAGVVPVLLEEANNQNRDVRIAALAALRLTAAPPDLPALVQRLFKADKGREHDEAEKTILAVCARIPSAEERVDPIITALASSSASDRLGLYPILGKLGGAKALKLVRAARDGDDAQLRAAGTEALLQWPDSSAAPDLLALAESTTDAKLKLRSLQNLIRINNVKNVNPGDKSNMTRLETLKKAMDLSTRDDERRQVLDALATVKELATLKYVLPYLDNSTLAQRACRTVVELAHSKTLREPNRAIFHAALDRVIDICRDAGLVERAKKYKE